MHTKNPPVGGFFVISKSSGFSEGVRCEGNVYIFVMIVVRVPGLESYRFQYPNWFVYTLRVETNSIGLRAPATRFKNAAAGTRSIRFTYCPCAWTRTRGHRGISSAL